MVNQLHSKKRFGWISNILLIIFLTGLMVHTAPPSPALAKAAAYDVGIVLPDIGVERWAVEGQRIVNAVTAAGYTAHLLFSSSSTATEKINVETLVAEGIKVLIFCPVNSTDAAEAAEYAYMSGVQVISYDRLIKGTAGVSYYITFDNEAVGIAQGQYLADKAVGTGIPLFLYAGYPGDNNALLFFKGSWKVLQPKIANGTFVIKNSAQAVSLQSNATLDDTQLNQIVNEITTNWNWDDAANLATANLAALSAADKGSVSILAPNDGTARAIANVFMADTDITGYVITGQDGEKYSIQYIIDGMQSMTVFKDTRNLADDAASTAVYYLINHSLPPSDGTFNNGTVNVLVKYSSITVIEKDDIVPVLVKGGYYNLSDFVWPGTRYLPLIFR